METHLKNDQQVLEQDKKQIPSLSTQFSEEEHTATSA